MTAREHPEAPVDPVDITTLAAGTIARALAQLPPGPVDDAAPEVQAVFYACHSLIREFEHDDPRPRLTLAAIDYLEKVLPALRLRLEAERDAGLNAIARGNAATVYPSTAESERVR